MTVTRTATPTVTPTATATPTATVTATSTATPSPTVTLTPTATLTQAAATGSPTPLATTTATATSTTGGGTSTPRPNTPTPVPGCPPDEWEPNNGFAQARALNYGDTLNGTICPTEDLDVFRIAVRDGDQITIRLSGQPPVYAIYLYNDRAIEVAAAEDFTPGDKVINYHVQDVAPDGADYYIMILTRSLDYNPNQYYRLLTTRVTAVMSPTPSPTTPTLPSLTPTTTATATANVSPTPTFTATAGPSPTATFTVTPGPSPTLTLSPTPRPQAFKLYLPHISHTAIGIQPEPTPTATPTKAPTETPGAPTPTATAAAGCADAYEPDNSRAQAHPITVDGVPQTHTIHTALDEDWVSFQAEAGKTYIIRTLNLAASVDTLLSVYTSDGIRDAVNDDDPASPPASRIDYVPAVSGTYYARVGDYNPGFGACDASYQISIEVQN